LADNSQTTPQLLARMRAYNHNPIYAVLGPTNIDSGMPPHNTFQQSYNPQSAQADDILVSYYAGAVNVACVSFRKQGPAPGAHRASIQARLMCTHNIPTRGSTDLVPAPLDSFQSCYSSTPSMSPFFHNPTLDPSTFLDTELVSFAKYRKAVTPVQQQLMLMEHIPCPAFLSTPTGDGPAPWTRELAWALIQYTIFASHSLFLTHSAEPRDLFSFLKQFVSSVLA
jgi:hypothetical protein